MMSRVCPSWGRLTIVNDVVNYCRVTHNVDMTPGSVIQALSDPTRRQIVTLLSGGPKRAGELAAEVGMSAPAISRHLRVLLSALVIADERLDEDARARVFRLRPQSIKTLQAWLDQLMTGRASLDAAADDQSDRQSV
jgi:DNA-binding transcriptional ArsR family regulator